MDNMRASAIFTVKSFSDDDDGERIITGLATSPVPDRMGDIIDPLGASFEADIPFLWQHQHGSVVGRAFLSKPTKDGIKFTARIAKISDPGVLKDLTDMAWQSIKAGLVRGVSIGFRGLEYARIEGTGGLHFLKSEIIELSAVSIPAHQLATIQTIKAYSANPIPPSSTFPLLSSKEASSCIKLRSATTP